MPSYPTPDLSHLTRVDYDHDIYEPAEDTFALLDALEADAERLQAARPRVCLEIGSGSGCVSAFLASILGCASAAYLATDINPHAARATVRTGQQNKAHINGIVTSLHLALLPRLTHAIDVLLFNPPYVPTSEDEQLDATRAASLAGAWAGGANGMAVTDELLSHVSTLLSHTGVFYLVAVPENKPLELIARMHADHALAGEVVLKRRAGGELLYILRFRRAAAMPP